MTPENVPPDISPPLPPRAEFISPPVKGPWGFWATVGFSVIMAILYFAAQLITVVGFVAINTITNRDRSTPLDEVASNGVVLGTAVILCAPLIVGASILFAWLRKGPPVADYLGLRWPSTKAIFGWLLAVLGFAIASDCLTVALGRPIVPEVNANIYYNTSFLPILWVGVCIAAPLSEEFLFRGFLFQGLAKSRLGGVLTVSVTAAAWAIIHLQYDAYGIMTIFVAGILFGFARLKTGSVLLCVAMHALMNVVATIQIPLFAPK